jgi:hypothetical protein
MADNLDIGFLIPWISVDAYQSLGQNCSLRKVASYLPSTLLHIPEDHLVDFAVRTSVSVSQLNHRHLHKVMFTLHTWLQTAARAS